MKEDSLFRMSFIIQDSSANTTTTYLSKMVETVLLLSETALTELEIITNIKDNFLLDFAIQRLSKLLIDQSTLTQLIEDSYLTRIIEINCCKKRALKKCWKGL